MCWHGMGSYLLREYLSFCNQGLVGEVILGTGYEGKCKCLLGKNLCEIISCFKGSNHKSKFFENLS